MSLSFNGIIFRESYWLGQRLHYFLPPSNLDRSQAHLPSYVEWSGAALGQGKRQLKSVLMEWGLVGLLVKNFMVKVTQDNEHTWFLWIPLRNIQIMPGSSKAGVAKWCLIELGLEGVTLSEISILNGTTNLYYSFVNRSIIPSVDNSGPDSKTVSHRFYIDSGRRSHRIWPTRGAVTADHRKDQPP